MKTRSRSKDAEKYRKLYKTKLWTQELRPMVLARDLFTCQRCGVALTKGRKKPSDAVVNHKKPHRGDMQLFSDPANLEAVCKKCHDIDIAKEERASIPPTGEDGWPVQVN